ncbi:MAG TPA: hypothetical protein PKZ16_00250 [bacterium]|nr:hypothetical protein [bacterium]HPL95679.1 hypothetical protein [bacterium]
MKLTSQTAKTDNEKKQPSKWWAFLGVLIILGASYFLLIMPLNQEYTSNKNLISTKGQELIDKEKIVKELEKLIELFNTIEPAVQKKISIFLPAEEDLSNLHYNFDQIAEGTGFKILAINVDTKQTTKNKESAVSGEQNNNLPQKTKKELKEMTAKIRFEGTSYINLKNLSLAIEENLRVFNISSFDYNPEKGLVEIILKTYYYN